MGTRIMTDSAGDLRVEEIRENQIIELPIVILVDEEEFYENDTIQKPEVYDRVSEGKEVKTAQITLHSFLKEFEEVAKSGDPCIYVSLSSSLSGTYNAACMAREEVIKKYPNFDLTIFDSKSVSYGQGWMAKRAAQLALEGIAKDEILEVLEFYRENMRILFTVGTLEYLYKGGRLSRTSAVLGGILGIAPVLGVEDGQVVVVAKQRGVKKAWRKMTEIVKVTQSGDLPFCILGNSGTVEDEERFRAFAEKQLDQKDLDVILPGAAIGAHTGPGLQAIFYVTKEEPKRSDG